MCINDDSFGHGGHGADWHPSRAFHMLRGEAAAWLYLLALLDAVFMIEQDSLVSKLSPEKMLASTLFYSLLSYYYICLFVLSWLSLFLSYNYILYTY